jgi:hypothetical protein
MIEECRLLACDVRFLRRVLQVLVTAEDIPISLILLTMMRGAVPITLALSNPMVSRKI